jgi:Exo70 exocyst complex subunit
MGVLSSIIPVRKTEVFQSTSIPPIGQFSRTFKALNTQIRTSPTQNLQLILSILEDLTTAQEMFTRIQIPKDAIDTIQREINSLEREAKGVGAVGIGDVIEDVKRRGQNIISLPSDGGIIDLTGEVTPPLPSPSQITTDGNSR